MTSSERYVADIVGLHARLTYAGLEDAIEGEPLTRVAGYGDGLTTLSVRQSQVPERYMKGILGFRLAQFLLTDLMDRDLAAQRALWHEPIVEAQGPDTVHTITLTDTGKLVGYLGFVGAPDPEPMPLDSPDRLPFPAEDAHHVELLSQYAQPGLTSHHAWEIKRFIRDRAMPRGLQRDRVPWHLILSLARTAVASDEMRLILGDATETGAIRHLTAMGFELAVVEGTEPSLSRDQLMWPSYELPRERRAKPWSALIRDDLCRYADAVEEGLLHDRDGDWQGRAIERLVELHKARAETATAA